MPAETNIEHIGIGLWRAAWAWRSEFAREMAQRGYPWHQEARGEVLAHLGPSGRGQAELVQAMGMTKQAVQQLIDQLEKEGVVRRVPGAKDRRSRYVELTALGLEDFRARTDVKRLIERRYKKRLGDENFVVLTRLLAALNHSE